MTMMVFRSARNTDLDAIHQLAEGSGVGITTLPKDIDLLKKRLEWSCASFKNNVELPQNEYYLFVLESIDTGEIVGTSAIDAATGYDAPFYSYKITKRTRICHELNIRSDYDVLSLVNDNQGHSEMCTLFLEPNHRINNNGNLLSRARFLFIAQYPERFASHIIAEMRGIANEQGVSPFWEQIGAHFFKMPFAEADRLTLSTDKQFINDLMPRQPIYVPLLSKAAQNVIGKPHPSTVPAMNILLREGFSYHHYVDIFDAGPTIEAARDQIRSIAESKVLMIESTMDDISSKRFMVANTNMDFRAVIAHIVINETQNSCIIGHDIAEALQVNRGDFVRVSPLHLASTSTDKKVTHES